jgi:hypothetical protein
MSDVFIGTEMLGRGALTRGQLRWNYSSIFPDVYAPKATVPSLRRNTVGAWLWSGRNGVIAGRAAAASHGALWVDAGTPIEMIWRSGRSPLGIVVRNERIAADEIVDVDTMPVTSPARTALDLAGIWRAMPPCGTSTRWPAQPALRRATPFHWPRAIPGREDCDDRRSRST